MTAEEGSTADPDQSSLVVEETLLVVDQASSVSADPVDTVGAGDTGGAADPIEPIEPIERRADVGIGRAGGSAARGSAPPRKPRRRKRIKRATIVAHRWTSLVLGVVLVVITTGGAAVVYAPEWVRWSNPSIFHVTRTAEPISVTQAMHIVDAEHPGYGANSVNVYDGLYEVRSASDSFPGFYGVDPGTGTVTGHADPDAGVMAFMEQLHECFFTCQSLPGYVPFLNDAVPTLGMRWLDGVTVSGAILGVAGLLLIFLALSGIWLWWPTLRRLSHGFRVRLDKGRYARDYDLHQAVGIVAVPFLLMWGVTGSSFEFHWVNSAWYAVTGGDQIPQDTFASAAAPTSTPDITPEQALAAAQVAAGPRAHVKYLSLPTAGDGTSTYTIEFSRDFDPWSHGSYPGQYGVEVDRHNAGRIDVDDSGSAPTWSNKLLDSWGAPMFHYGQSVNGWWRIPWFLFGLTPLLLAITGVSTWLAKRSVRRARARAAAGAPSPAPTAAAVP